MHIGTRSTEAAAPVCRHQTRQADWIAMKHVEILYFAGCPNYDPAVRLTKTIVEKLGIEVCIDEVEIVEPVDAARHRFLGSPTIRVDGLDIEPSARSRTDFGFCCRTYSGRGIPPAEMLNSALSQEQNSKNVEWSNGSDC